MILTRAQVEQLVAQMRADAPQETCGMIGGQDGRAEKIYPIPNIAENRVKNYFMEGSAQIRAMQDMDDNGHDILAIYHSHPVTQPYPSATDLRDAWDADLQEPRYPDTLYLIMSLRNPDAPEIRAYQLHDQTISEITLEIRD